MALGIGAALGSGHPELLTQALVNGSATAIERALTLLGIVSIWLGVARVAEKSGFLQSAARLLSPLLVRLFPDVPKGHPALSYITMNLTANVFGFGNAATPFGLKAMKELQKLNREPDTASRPMCTFLAINTSSVTLIPTTLIAMRTSLGSTNPEAVVVSGLIATTISTIAAIILDRYFARRSQSR
ncbi:MAG: spore maturation protein [Firmicutes bacterium]|nr:spore maturation protein [Bacillota bacterium]